MREEDDIEGQRRRGHQSLGETRNRDSGDRFRGGLLGREVNLEYEYVCHPISFESSCTRVRDLQAFERPSTDTRTSSKSEPDPNTHLPSSKSPNTFTLLAL